MHEYAGISISCSNLGNYNHFLSCMIDEIRIWAHTFACSFCTSFFFIFVKEDNKYNTISIEMWGWTCSFHLLLSTLILPLDENSWTSLLACPNVKKLHPDRREYIVIVLSQGSEISWLHINWLYWFAIVIELKLMGHILTYHLGLQLRT
jgi:hypothetical protein